MRPASPFVLLDDARDGGLPARLYRDAVRIVTAETVDAVAPAIESLRAAIADGREVAGYLAYEAGAAFVARAPAVAAAAPLLWFGVFERHETLTPAALAALLPDPAGAWAGVPVPGIAQAEYDAALATVLDYIRAGDIYQANLTFRATVPFLGDPLALYARLRVNARAGYGAVVDTGAQMLLSLSPELFFALDGDALTCRPMKGTAARAASAAEDRARVAALADDAKQRAENLMIVDLMRNDLSRIAMPGSVAVPHLFTVETYPTIHQMTSTVTATLAPDRDAIDALAALFPCGSITGAPKQRAMTIVAEVEPDPRGAYTGAIGSIDADGALFNVAIRTLVVPHGNGRSTLGLGSGIVADSAAGEEWAECLAKGAFVTAGQRRVDLIETMAFDPEIGLLRLETHLARLKTSAEALGFSFDRHAARNELQAATFRLRTMRRIRLLLSATGAIAIDVSPMPPPVSAPIAVAIVPLPVAASDYRLRHKTSDRDFYDRARRDAGTAEVVFELDGHLTEGSYTSVFVERDGVLLTPPLAHGLLPGVLRADLIAEGRAAEAALTRDDLAGGFYVGNALRGLMPAIVAVAKADAGSL